MLKLKMEMPDQELPVVFSQMLQMFPNIPQDIIWLNVQQYSRDVEKCAQMLNLQNSKYDALKSTLNSTENLNKNNNVVQVPYFMLPPESALDDNSDMPLSMQLPVLSSGSDAFNAKYAIDKQQTEKLKSSSSSQFFSNAMPQNYLVDSSKKLRETKFINFNEPLVLDIVPDDDDISHSWRPNVSADILCSDFFAPSGMSENFQLNSNLVPSFNIEQNSQVVLNPEGMDQESWSSNNSSHMLYGYPQENEQHYEKDIANYLHYQKSQMNAIRYEVIKAKIEQGELKEEIEKLSLELKEKMQSKSVQDIEELNGEIVQLRLECQCLCTDVDKILNDQGLLGEVDEKCYEKNNPPSESADTQRTKCSHCTNSPRINNDDTGHDDSNKWQCSKCTFANHSAISVCEMCNTPKPSTHRSAFLHVAPSSCYCHPKENSLSVQS